MRERMTAELVVRTLAREMDGYIILVEDIQRERLMILHLMCFGFSIPGDFCLCLKKSFVTIQARLYCLHFKSMP